VRELRRVWVFDGEEAAVVKLMHGIGPFECAHACHALGVLTARSMSLGGSEEMGGNEDVM
jgi:hypothetical protein